MRRPAACFAATLPSLFLAASTCRARPLHHPAYFQHQHQAAFIGPLFPPPVNMSGAPLLRRDAYEDRAEADGLQQQQEEEVGKTDTADDIADSSSGAKQPKSAALNELKERAKAVGQLEAINKGAGAVAKMTEKLAGKGGGRMLGSAGKQTGKRTLQKAGSRAGRKVTSRAGERASRAMGKRVGGKVGKRAVAAGRANAAVARQSGTCVAPALRGAGKKLAVSKQGVTSARAAAKATITRSPNKAAGKMLQKTSARLPQLKKGVLLQNARRKGTAVAARHANSTRRALSATTRRVALRRFGRGLLIALPALGGLFALLTLRSDFVRANEELERRRAGSGTGDLESWSLLAFALFAVAACADYVDTLCHVLISRTVLLHHLRGNLQDMMVTESVSMGCAVVSTVGAVVGEVASHRHLDSLLSEGESSSQLQQ